MAEYLLRAGLARRAGAAAAGWSIRSAGIHAEPGLPIHPSAAKPLLRRGIDDFSSFRSRRIGPGSISEADLVLAASREHRAAVVTMAPDAMSRTFTLRGFARLVAGASALETVGARSPRDVAAAGLALVDEALGQRSRVQPLDPAHEDIVDPIGHSWIAFRRCADQIEQSVTAILDGLPVLDVGESGFTRVPRG